jgi:hypothetical protein
MLRRTFLKALGLRKLEIPDIPEAIDAEAVFDEPAILVEEAAVPAKMASDMVEITATDMRVDSNYR